MGAFFFILFKSQGCHLIAMNIQTPTSETWMTCPLIAVMECQTLQLDLQKYVKELTSWAQNSETIDKSCHSVNFAVTRSEKTNVATYKHTQKLNTLSIGLFFGILLTKRLNWFDTNIIITRSRRCRMSILLYDWKLIFFFGVGGIWMLL